MSISEREQWLWFCSIPGLTYNQQTALFRYFGCVENIILAKEEEIELLGRHDRKWIRNVIQWRTHVEKNVERVRKYMDMRDIRFLERDHKEFPKRLRNIMDPPYGIFVQGRLPGDDKKSIAVIGARACSSYGLHFAKELGAALGKYDVQVISGMACGVDGAAQTGTLQVGGYSCGVLGSGVDVCYPAENTGLYHELKSNGCLISEYPCGSQPMPFHFPQRNRIISALSDKVVVIEARNKSGSLITADIALEQGKDVYAVPGRAGDALSAGCNRLIREGAGIIVSIDDFLVECGLKEEVWEKEGSDMKNRYPSGLDRNEQMVWEQLDFTPAGIREISDRTGLSYRETAAALVTLQLLGRAEEVGKNYYVQNKGY